MSRYKTEVRGMGYNAASRCFEALVIFHEGPDKQSFPCSLNLPITSDFKLVTDQIIASAKAQRKRGAGSLVSLISSTQNLTKVA